MALALQHELLSCNSLWFVQDGKLWPPAKCGWRVAKVYICVNPTRKENMKKFGYSGSQVKHELILLDTDSDDGDSGSVMENNNINFQTGGRSHGTEEPQNISGTTDRISLEKQKKAPKRRKSSRIAARKKFADFWPAW